MNTKILSREEIDKWLLYNAGYKVITNMCVSDSEQALLELLGINKYIREVIFDRLALAHLGVVITPITSDICNGNKLLDSIALIYDISIIDEEFGIYTLSTNGGTIDIIISTQYKIAIVSDKDRYELVKTIGRWINKVQRYRLLPKLQMNNSFYSDIITVGDIGKDFRTIKWHMQRR